MFGKPAPAEAFFSPGDACRHRIVHRFNVAKKTVDACVFTITDDRISKVILEAHRRGVKIRLATDELKAFDPGSDIDEFRRAGIPVVIDATLCHMHHKFAIFDGTRLLNGSYNWTRGAAEQNAQNIIDTGDPVLLKAFQHEFDALWAKLSVQK